MSQITIRLRYVQCSHSRSPKGQARLDKVDTTLSLGNLKEMIEHETKIPSMRQKIKMGYPPKVIPKGNDSKTLKELGFVNGEQLTIEESDEIESDSPLKPQPKNYSKIPAKPTGKIVKRSIAADNSCLFNAFAYSLEGVLSLKNSRAPYLRQVISDIVQFDKETYNSVFLDQAPSDYCHWIMKKDSWGGAIELSILSDFYQVEICAFDVKSCRMDCFGQDKKYQVRVYLLYNGIHYDVLALSEDGAPEEMDITLFSPHDTNTEAKALQFVKGANKRHEYTDVSDFKLVCLQCYTKLVGQKEAVEHANKTGHDQFAENQ